MIWILLSLFLAITIVISYYPCWQQRSAIKRWDKALGVTLHKVHFQQLFNDIDGFALSRQARAPYDAIEYTYGEIDFTSFIALLSLTKPNSSSVFYDLGSGTGKAVLACTMVFNVQKSCGVELLSPLNHAALEQQQRLQQLPGYLEKSKAIHFINNDFLSTDFSDATHIFINATAFFGDTWTSIHQALRQVKAGTIIITTSKNLRSDEFMVLKTTKVQMSWGPIFAYIHQRS